MCRWVHTTRSIFSRGLPTFSRSCKNGNLSLFHSGLERTLSLPIQESTSTRLPCDSMISAWMVSLTLPSSVENGESQSRSFLTFSALALGSNIVPSHTASDSITRLIFTSPIFHWFIARSSLLNSRLEAVGQHRHIPVGRLPASPA